MSDTTRYLTRPVEAESIAQLNSANRQACREADLWRPLPLPSDFNFPVLTEADSARVLFYEWAAQEALDSPGNRAIDHKIFRVDMFGISENDERPENDNIRLLATHKGLVLDTIVKAAILLEKNPEFTPTPLLATIHDVCHLKLRRRWQSPRPFDAAWGPKRDLERVQAKIMQLCPVIHLGPVEIRTVI